MYLRLPVSVFCYVLDPLTGSVIIDALRPLLPRIIFRSSDIYGELTPCRKLKGFKAARRVLCEKGIVEIGVRVAQPAPTVLIVIKPEFSAGKEHNAGTLYGSHWSYFRAVKDNL